MFGYVRPLKPELKVKEYELFKAAYCGLCNSLKERYGTAARYVVNYDLVFLAMLLTSGEEVPAVCSKCCPASPCRKKQYIKSNASFLTAADYSIILTYWKLADAANDGPFFKKIYIRPLMLLMRSKYRRAAKLQPDFAQTTEKMLAELSELEKGRNESIDETADKFALILAKASDGTEDISSRRILYQILYQLGRFIYILDAYDDYSENVKSGSYNPIIYRFHKNGTPLNAEEKCYIQNTLILSEGMISSAFELKSTNVYHSILSNIIYLGLPNVRRLVFSGRSDELKYTNSIHRKNIRSRK